MKSFQQKRGFKNVLHSKPVLVLLSILVFLFAWGMIGFFGKLRLTIENREIAKNKVMQLEQEKEKLSSDIVKLNTETGIEESIREKFGLVKDGEGVVIIVEDKNPPQPPKKEPRGFFSFFINLFK